MQSMRGICCSTMRRRIRLVGSDRSKKKPPLIMPREKCREYGIVPAHQRMEAEAVPRGPAYAENWASYYARMGFLSQQTFAASRTQSMADAFGVGWLGGVPSSKARPSRQSR
jgi:hypothetical protein